MPYLAYLNKIYEVIGKIKYPEPIELAVVNINGGIFRR